MKTSFISNLIISAVITTYKFDGTDFTNYTDQNSDLALFYINTVAVDASGVVWLGTENNGMISF
ncbi:MAG: hypothetical protein IH946_08105 [Bacteroidetes bacterium]|nr:hypothetical protein [Bacteroidota bacterium]